MIYERIVGYCRDENISISEFEKLCKIGNGTVGKWRDDKSSPSVKTLNKIVIFTGISISYWIGGSNV